MLRYIKRFQSRDLNIGHIATTVSIIVPCDVTITRKIVDFQSEFLTTMEHPLHNPGIRACNKLGEVPTGLGKIWQDCEAKSILARQGQADEKLFQDDSGFERAASFEVKVGPEEPRRKLVDATWAEVGVLSTDGPGVSTGHPTGFVEAHARGSEPAGMVDLEQVGAHGCQKADRRFTGGQ
jgi:hypothetical protein